MEPIKLYLACRGAPLNCTCAVERNEAGETILPDFNLCAFTVEAHQAAIERAQDQLTATKGK